MSRRSPAREKNRRARRGGVKSITLGPRDGAVVMRSNGRVTIDQPRARVDPRREDNALWMTILRWLFSEGEDAAERRQAIKDEFLMDVQEMVARRREEAAELLATQRAREALASVDPGDVPVNKATAWRRLREMVDGLKREELERCDSEPDSTE